MQQGSPPPPPPPPLSVVLRGLGGGGEEEGGGGEEGRGGKRGEMGRGEDRRCRKDTSTELSHVTGVGGEGFLIKNTHSVECVAQQGV